LHKVIEREQVEHFMSELEHPLKTEIEFIRNVIKSAGPEINERIKWNAPSYYHIQEVAT
jgi:uncharacterized protein YdhG (YjbR/CyaY superfamily)